MTKLKCLTCKKPRDIDKFRKNRSLKKRFGRHSECKACEKLRPRTRPADRRMRQRYGITGVEYDSMLAAQNGRCAICRSLPGRRRLHVDHCHKTGAVRGLLCVNCNHLCGVAFDDVKLLRKAVEYLTKSGR
jgi:hypothetical protein